MVSECFEQIWQDLEMHARDTSGEGILTLRVLPDSAFDFYLGVHHPQTLRTLLIRVSRENVMNQSSFPHSKGFEIRQTVLPEDGKRSVTILLIPNGERYQEIFSRLAEDVVSNCSNQTSERAMIKALLLRLEMWHQFMDRFGPDGLNPAEQRGLYGEIRFIHDYLIPHLGPGLAVAAWTGPQRKPQDFQLAGMAVEVKTSIAGQHQVMHIAGEQQLDDTGLEALYLWHLSLRELRDGGRTLPEIVDAVRDVIRDEAGVSSAFEGLLIMAGYLDEHREKYETGYADRSASIFHVRDGFPRITERSLISGVGDVRYSVTLAACSQFRVSDETLVAAIKG